MNGLHRPGLGRQNKPPAMKLLNEYLERAISLERMAAAEQNSTFKRNC
jgi:hypothetical protein